MEQNRDRGATTFAKLGVQFLGLGYCTEQNTDGILSFVDCSLLCNGNHTLHQKSWGGPSKFWGSGPPNLPSDCALEQGETITANILTFYLASIIELVRQLVH